MPLTFIYIRIDYALRIKFQTNRKSIFKQKATTSIETNGLPYHIEFYRFENESTQIRMNMRRPPVNGI